MLLRICEIYKITCPTLHIPVHTGIHETRNTKHLPNRICSHDKRNPSRCHTSRAWTNHHHYQHNNILFGYRYYRSQETQLHNCNPCSYGSVQQIFEETTMMRWSLSWPWWGRAIGPVITKDSNQIIPSWCYIYRLMILNMMIGVYDLHTRQNQSLYYYEGGRRRAKRRRKLLLEKKELNRSNFFVDRYSLVKWSWQGART